MAAITTEVYFVYVDNEQPPDLSAQMKAQYQWLQKDLANARAVGSLVVRSSLLRGF